ncbi:DEFB107A-like protein [Gulo gulo luscus]|uniref:Beta-defensin n=1 Tax=Neovison vison TaxID=452646 RepID=A0A8C7ARB0_NEOVI|nr:beta-defensin 107 [Neogale vison]KAI5767268.1 DEFB107A-like protein [Gulo gulo luscus]KAI5767377.1 DEFB107A-like protein [Gulo gulo luscus]UQT06072.1 DEFB107A [Gulo gulo luscus]
MSGAMRIFSLISAALILLVHIFSAHGGIYRQIQCKKRNGRCEVECLSFEVKIGGCRAELTPFCCKKKGNK